MTQLQSHHLAGDHEEHRSFSLEEWVIALVLAVMTATLFSQIIARFVFSASFAWSEELSRYLFVWLVFLGLGAVTLRKEHIIVDALTARLPHRLRSAMVQGCYAVLFTINVLIVVSAVQMIYILFDLGQDSPALALPMWLVYLSVPVGLTIMSVRLIQMSFRLWKTPEGEDL